MLNLESLIIEPKLATHIKGSVIWLHGLGADGYDFEHVVNALGFKHIRFVLPHAPARAVSINNGYVMPAWYDIMGREIDSPQDKIGIEQTQLQIEALIADEVAKGIPHERIVLAGFSQGGAIALHTGLRHKRRLAGILALSTYLPLKDSLSAEAAPANADIPILMAHGIYDDVIVPIRAKSSAKLLTDLGYQVQWLEYPMAHSVSNEELADIHRFLTTVLTAD